MCTGQERFHSSKKKTPPGNMSKEQKPCGVQRAAAKSLDKCEFNFAFEDDLGTFSKALSNDSNTPVSCNPPVKQHKESELAKSRPSDAAKAISAETTSLETGKEWSPKARHTELKNTLPSEAAKEILLELAENSPIKSAKGKPSETAKAKPSEPAKEKPLNALHSRSLDAANTNKVLESAKAKPSESAKAKPSESAKAKPSESAKAKPSESAKAKPSESAKAKPSESAKAKPSEVAKAKPSESAKAKPSESAKAKPSESAKAKPSESAKAKPSESAKAKPSEVAKAKPLKSERTQSGNHLLAQHNGNINGKREVKSIETDDIQTENIYSMDCNDDLCVGSIRGSPAAVPDSLPVNLALPSAPEEEYVGMANNEQISKPQVGAPVGYTSSLI